MPNEFINDGQPPMNWKKYLARMRRAFGENEHLADAYDRGYKDGIHKQPHIGEHESTAYSENEWGAYDTGYEDGREDRTAQFAGWGRPL